MISSSRAQAGAIALFVLLWGSAGIFTRIGLDHGSVMAMLILRFAIALPMVIMLGHFNGGWLPPKGQRLLPAISGLLMIGLYSFFLFLKPWLKGSHRVCWRRSWVCSQF